MNGRERVACAMSRRRPDRVPVFCQLALGHYFLHAGLPPHRIWFTSEGFAEALVRLQRRYGFDGILVNLPGRPPGLLSQVARVQARPEGETLYWRNGETTFVPVDDNPQHRGAGGADVCRADFAALDPDRLEGLDELTGYTWNTYHVPRIEGKAARGMLEEVPDYFLRTIDLVKTAVRGEVSVHGEVFSPFTHFTELLGYAAAMEALATDAGKVRALLDRLTAASVAWAEAQARRGVDAVLVSSAFAGAGFISRRMYLEFVAPYERRLNRAIRAAGVPAYTHTCGRIGDRLDLLAGTETCGLDTLDPPPLGDVELAQAKARVGGQVFIKGNMNAVALLDYRTPEEVEAEGAACLRAGAPGGGYILSTACSVAPRVAPWKLELLAPLAERLGRYADDPT
jgi:hypothetical protein